MESRNKKQTGAYSSTYRRKAATNKSLRATTETAAHYENKSSSFFRRAARIPA